MKKNNITTFTLLVILGVNITGATMIVKSTNEILFKPRGKLIPELSWATLRTKINITDMFKETNELCKAVHIMKKGYERLNYRHRTKEITIPPTKLKDPKAYMIKYLSHSIEQMCRQNTQIVYEIINVFNLKRINKPEYIPNLEDDDTFANSLMRQARQVFVGTALAVIGVVTSLVSIFTSSELLKMSSSSDTENALVDNNNHIITSLQSHENAIHRNEAALNQMKDHLLKLETHLSIEKQTFDVYLGLTAIKIYGTSTTTHLQRIQDGLYELLKNKLSPKLVPLTQLNRATAKLRDLTMKKGYELTIKSASDIYMCETSFVSYENGNVFILTHIPMFKNKHLLKLFEYQPTPIILSQQSDQQLTIKPEKPIIAVDDDMTLYSVFDKEEIHHDCSSIHDSHYCKNKNILKRTSFIDCTLALYKKDKKEIKERCALEVSTPQEVIIQLNSTSFYIYSPNHTDISISCPPKGQIKENLEGFNIVTLSPGCRANINRHVFTSGIEVEETIKLKQTTLDLHLKELMEISSSEEKELLQLIKEETLINEKPINIVDIKKKYNLHILKKRNNLYGTLFGSVSSVTTMIIFIVAGWIIYKRCFKKKQLDTKTFCRYDTIRGSAAITIPSPNFEPLEKTGSTATDITSAESNAGEENTGTTGTRPLFSVKKALMSEDGKI